MLTIAGFEYDGYRKVFQPPKTYAVDNHVQLRFHADIESVSPSINA